MPPALETIDLDSEPEDLPSSPEEAISKPPSQYTQQSLIPVIQRTSTKPVPPRQYPDGPLPLRPSDNAPRKAHITGRVAEDDGVFYTLMVGSLQIKEVSVSEILQFVSPYELEEFENAQFTEEEEARKIAKAAEEADREARRLRKLERIRSKGIVLREDPLESNDDEDGEMEVGRHGRARPTYTHLYRLPDIGGGGGGGKDGGRRRRRKRDPRTGELMPLSDENSSDDDDGVDVKGGPVGRSISQASPFASGLQPPKRRRRKRDPVTGELMPLGGGGGGGDDENVGSSDGGMALQQQQQPSRSSSIQMTEQPARTIFKQQTLDTSFPPAEPSARSNSILSAQLPTGSSSPVRKATSNITTVELPKRRRRKRDPVTGELLLLDPEPWQTTTISSTMSSSRQPTEERKKRPRRRRHPITGELMPLGWVYDPNEEARGSKQAVAEVPSMDGLSLARESKRVRLMEDSSPRLAQASASASSPQVRRTQIVNLSDTSSEEEEELEENIHIQRSVEKAAPPPPPAAKATMSQIRSPPKHNMMQRAISESSSNEPITLESFLSTAATGKANRGGDSTSSSSEEEEEEKEAHEKIASQKTSMLNPMASTAAPQQNISGIQNDDNDNDDNEEDSDEEDELNEGEFYIEGIHAHHMSDPRTHPGRERVMLYQTKWEGWEEMTWEPVESFPDRGVVEEYRRRVGMKGRIS